MALGGIDGRIKDDVGDSKDPIGKDNYECDKSERRCNVCGYSTIYTRITSP